MKTANLNPKTYRLATSVAGLAILILFASTLSVRDSSAKPINEGVNQVAPTPTTAFTPTPITHSDSWRLPFDGEKRIWNGPGEGLHTGNSSEAMDFLSRVGAADHFDIVAPADGQVVEYTNDPQWGNVLRIYHPSTKSCSFFAHLESAYVTSPGQSVTQGQVIAVAGDTGGQQEIHLHFEARDTCTFGQVNSGKSFPFRAIMGIWWSQWYAPPPYLTVSPTKVSNSGRAEYPVNSTPPAGMLFTATPRHLSNTFSPSDFPSAYASNISNSQATIHMGAAPDVAGHSTEDANFQIQEYQPSQSLNPWVILENFWEKPTYTRSFQQVIQRCGANGQYCYTVRSRTSSKPLTSPRYVDIHPGIPGSKPHIAAFYNINQATVTLEYAWSGALRYIVYERHGGQTFIAYDGQASQVTINRILGNTPNVYQVSVQISALQWINSEWLYLHNQIVVIPTSTPTRTPTPAGTPTWPAPDSNCSDGQCVFAVSGSADDAGTEPVFSSCAYSVADNEIYLGECSAEGIISGFRFPGVNVSQGAQIASAYLAVWVDGPYSDLLQLKLYGEASNDAAAFSATSKPSDRPLTVASVNWTVPTSDFWYDGTQFRFTPNIAPLVQEIVNRPGWGSGNAMVMIVKNIDSSIYRRVYAYDRELNTTHTVRLVITLTNP